MVHDTMLAEGQEQRWPALIGQAEGGNIYIMTR